MPGLGQPTTLISGAQTMPGADASRAQKMTRAKNTHMEGHALHSPMKTAPRWRVAIAATGLGLQMILNSGTRTTPNADAKQDLMTAATILVKLSMAGVVTVSQNTMMLAMAVTDANGPGA